MVFFIKIMLEFFFLELHCCVIMEVIMPVDTKVILCVSLPLHLFFSSVNLYPRNIFVSYFAWGEYVI